MSRVAHAGTVLAVLSLPGCAQFRAAPIDPAERARQFCERSLQDEGLHTFLEDNVGANLEWPPGHWDFPMLVLVGLYFHPDIELARSRIDLAEARIITARTLPNPTFSFTARYNTDAPKGPSGSRLSRAVRQGVRDGVVSGIQDQTGLDLGNLAGGEAEARETPWTLIYGVEFPVDISNKRKHRISEAQHVAAAAHISLLESAWQIRSRVRNRLNDYVSINREREILQREAQIRQGYLELLEERLRLRDVLGLDVESARIELDRTRLAIAAAETRRLQILPRVAESVGLPVYAFREIAVAGAEFESPSLLKITADEAQELALQNRLDIRRALVEYAATESTLQLEIAKQIPDIDLGPGYRWNQGDKVWSLGFSLPLPILNQNQGPIAEAEARRKEALAQFLALQAQVIADAQSTAAQVEGARDEHAAAANLLNNSRCHRVRLEEMLKAGEADAASVALAELQVVLAENAVLDALGKLHTALGALEDATQTPLYGANPVDAVSYGPPRSDSLGGHP